jgi:hypothetical protein
MEILAALNPARADQAWRALAESLESIARAAAKEAEREARVAVR